MDLSYYNPLTRLKLFSNVWAMSGRVKKKLNAENPGTAPSRLFLCADYLGGWLSHGFSIVQYEDYEIFKLPRLVRKNIITNRRALKLEARYNSTNAIKWLENKALFNERFSSLVKRKWCLLDQTDRASFIECFKGQSKVIIKPVGGEKGEGIEIRHIDDHSIGSLYDELKGRKYLVEEVIRQHPDMMFGRTSVNTIRMYTLLDRTGKAHLLKSVLRIGAVGMGVDNYHSGGSIWPLDRKDGFVEISGKTLNVTDPISRLPETGHFMIGYNVPNYEKATAAVIKGAEMIPEVRYIGWDVAVTKDGVEIIEANSSPDNDFHCLGTERHYYNKLLNIADA